MLFQLRVAKPVLTKRVDDPLLQVGQGRVLVEFVKAMKSHAEEPVLFFVRGKLLSKFCFFALALDEAFQNFFRCSSCHLVSPSLSFMTNKNILLMSPLTAFTVSRKHRKRLTICFSREIMVRSNRPTHVFSLSCEMAFPPFALTPLDEWEPIAAHRVSASTSAYGPSMREQEAS